MRDTSDNAGLGAVAAFADTPDPAQFYKTGGTMAGDAASYVPRRTDLELFQSLGAGEFCYVLTSRQMGKSSLMVHTASKLRAAGASVVLLDLTAFGRNLTAEQWYESLRDRLARQLQLEEQLQVYADQTSTLSPLQRWMGAITDVALKRLEGKLVIFLDEIDFARSLPFSTDEFFAAIRSCYNRRVLEPGLERLTFCLLGVASPSDLIRDSRTTPFNVGKRIELTDFTRTEAAPLAQGLRCAADSAQTVLARVLHWTGGHPYLTQRLCRAAAEARAADTGAVDELCEELFLSTRARTSDDNLLFAREQMLRSDVDSANLLILYWQIRQRKRVVDDPTNQLISVLRLSGVIRSADGRLTVSNRVYERVFDQKWVETSMPDQEKRRQRAAYRRGLMKAGLYAAVIVAAVGGLAGYALLQGHNAAHQQHLAETALHNEELQRQLAETQRQRADEKTHDADAARKQAEAAQSLAETRRKAAEAAQADATRAKGLAEQQKRLFEQTQTTANNSSRSASLQLAGGLVARGDALALAGRWGEARTSYDDSLAAYSRASASVFEADLALFSLFAHSPPPLLMLPVQESPGTCVAFSADGRLALSGAANGSVTLWNLPTGTERFAFEGHTGAVRSVALAPDGRTAVSGSADGSVRTWDITSGAALGTTTICKPATTQSADPENALLLSFDFCFTSQGGRVVASDADGVTIRDLKTNSVIRKIAARFGRVRIAPDGSSLVLLHSDSASQLWSLGQEGADHLLNADPPGANDAAYSADGHLLATAGADGAIRLWDVISSSLLKTFAGSSAPIKTVSFSPDGTQILAGGDDHLLRVWDVSRGCQLLDFARHSRSVLACAVSPEGRLALSAGADRGLVLWSLSNEAEAVVIRGTSGRSPAISDDGRMVTFDTLGGTPVAGKDQRTITIFDLGSGLPVFTGNISIRALDDQRFALADDQGPIGTFIVAPNDDGQEQRSVVVQSNGSLIFHHEKGDVTSTAVHEGAVKSVRLSHDGRLAVSAGDDQTAKLWDAATGALLTTYAGHTGCVNDAAIRPDDAIVATGSSDGDVRLWDAKSSREIRSFQRRRPFTTAVHPHANSVQSVHFSPDGRLLFVGYGDMETEVWDFSRPLRLREMEAELDNARAALRRDSRDLAAMRVLGEWCEMRGVWDWAADALATSKCDAGAEDCTRLARCYWLAGAGDLAMPLVKRVLEGKGPQAGYARLLGDLILADHSIPKSFSLGGESTSNRQWKRIRQGTWRETLDGVPQADFQLTGRTQVKGVQGALLMRLPIRQFQQSPEIRTQVFIAEDGSLAASRLDPQAPWNVSGAITVLTAANLHPPVVGAREPTVIASGAAIDGGDVDKSLRAAAEAESKGNFTAAAADYEQAARLEKLTAAAVLDLQTKCRSMLDAGDPASALDALNHAVPRVRSAAPIAELKAEIADLQMRAPSYFQRGSEALKRNSPAEAFSDFSNSARGGFPEGMLRLGDLYKAGLGVKADKAQAELWWTRAAKSGNAEANERLRSNSERLGPFLPGRS